MSLSVVHKTFRPGAPFDAESTIDVGEGWVALTEATSGELTAGHRYLILAHIHIYQGPISRNVLLRLSVGGTPDVYQSFVYGGNNGVRHQPHIACVRTPGAGASIKIEAAASGGTCYLLQAEMVLIDLDTGDLTENVDLIVNQNTIALTNSDTDYSASSDGASATFTPDGSSNYLVVVGGVMKRADLGFAFAGYGLRLRDVTNSNTLVEVTNNDAPNDKNQTQIHGLSLYRVLEAPTATPLQVTVQHFGSNEWEHVETDLTILRLDRLASYAYDQDDTVYNALPRYMPPNVLADPERNSTPYTPDSLGVAVFLAFGEHLGISADGYCHQVRYGASPSGTVVTTMEWPTIGGNALADNDAAVTPRTSGTATTIIKAIGALSGLAQAEEDVYLYMGRDNGDSPGINKSTLVVLGTEMGAPVIGVAAATAPDANTIRITFSQAMLKDSRLLALSNYTITPADPATVALGLQSIVAENVTQPTWVEITCTEMTDGGDYDVAVSTDPTTGPRDATDTPLTSGTTSLTGVGDVPGIARVEAIGPNRIDVVFTEIMADTPEIRDASKYTFDNGLNVLNVLDVIGERVQLVTDDQTPGTLYTLTITQ